MVKRNSKLLKYKFFNFATLIFLAILILFLFNYIFISCQIFNKDIILKNNDASNYNLNNQNQNSVQDKKARDSEIKSGSNNYNESNNSDDVSTNGSSSDSLDKSGGNQKFYLSKSNEFINYSFIYNEEWKLYEVNDGKKVLLEKKEKSLPSASLPESFFIFVLNKNNFEELNSKDEIFQTYVNSALDDKTVNFFKKEIINCNNRDIELIGYSYITKLSLEENHNENVNTEDIKSGNGNDNVSNSNFKNESNNNLNDNKNDTNKNNANVKESNISDNNTSASNVYSTNVNNFNCIDYFTVLESADSFYCIKYISANKNFNLAKNTFIEFLENFNIGNNLGKLNSDNIGSSSNGNISNSINISNSNNSSISSEKAAKNNVENNNDINKNSNKESKSDENSKINILVLGDDSGMGRPGGRVNGRTDIIIILHLNLQTCKGTAVTIPRDTWVEIPGYGEGKINGAHAIGGMQLTIKTIEKLSGLKIDNYIITDFDGFVPLIDFLGGVTIEVGEDLSDGFSGCYLTKGVHHIGGKQALALARNRHRAGDGTTQGGAFAREREAAKIVVNLLEQKSTIQRIIAMPLYINYLLKYTWTDFTLRDILKILPVLGKIKAGDIEIIGIPSWPQTIGNASAVVYDAEATAELFEEINSQ